MKTFSSKKPSKEEREQSVLIGLVELYLQTGKPVGSQTLKENGFDSLSPATLRNYFAKLEEGGFLKQHHTSGGRTPTNLAYKTYASTVSPTAELTEQEKLHITQLLDKETREVHLHLQQTAETLSMLSQGAVFLSSPRFDQDFIIDIKLVSIDTHRILCILITDFGTIRSEILLTEKKLSTFSLKRIEKFFHWKLTGTNKVDISPEEEKIGLTLYNEAMLRHIMNYSTFSSSEILKTGFAKMLSYPDFNDASSLAGGLALFENDNTLRTLLAECNKKKELTFWIGDELSAFSPSANASAILAIPYYIHQTLVGSIAILCPARAPYKKLFALLKTVSELLSTSLTKSLYKFKISYREPQAGQLDYRKQTTLLSEPGSDLLLEDQTQGKTQ